MRAPTVPPIRFVDNYYPSVGHLHFFAMLSTYRTISSLSLVVALVAV